MSGRVQQRTVSVLVIGAGPYGLSAAAAARAAGLDTVVVGKTMEFWRRNMPEGMLLRSGPDWHLDPQEEATYFSYLQSLGAEGRTPIPVETYIDYVDWFCRRKELEPEPLFVQKLERQGDLLRAEFQDGSHVLAKNVVAAIGFEPFAYYPEELRIPGARHTVDLVGLDELKGKRVLIVGGRQSAFEWAALLRDRGVDVALTYRHATPRFEESDWSWVDALVDTAEANPGWFRKLPEKEREAIAHRFWQIGREQLEPWLATRIEGARLFPDTRVTGWEETQTGLIVRLGEHETEVDQVILATGYRVRTENIPYLDPALLAEIETDDGWPVMDDSFQTSARGLYLPGLTATRQFGPFFGFVRGCRAAARMMVRGMRNGRS